MVMTTADANEVHEPGLQWSKVTGPDALSPLDRHWIRYVRIILMLTAVLITWRILAWQDDGYRTAALEAGVAAGMRILPPTESIPSTNAPVIDDRPSPGPIVVVSPTAIPTAKPSLSPTPTPAPDLLIHRVRPGDTLSGISQIYDVPITSIMEINNLSDRDALVVNQQLRLPEDARVPDGNSIPGTYTVRSGDTLSAIAVNFGMSLDDLMVANGLADANSIFVGQELRLPDG